MKEPIFYGAATALITPFSGGKVDFRSLGRIIDSQIDAGIDALVVCGTTGEAATMSDAEKIDATAFTVERAHGRVPVIAGASSNDTDHASSLCRAVESVGADALLVSTPYYNKTSQRGLIESFTYIADRVSKPIILYNVPSRTGVNIEPETYAELAKHPNIAAIKEAGGNFSKIAETAALVGDALTLYSGNDDMTVPMMSLGAAGVISVLSNVLPYEVHEMCCLFLDGNISKSAAMQLKYIPMIKALFSDVNPIPIKTAMAMIGACEPTFRLPLTSLDEDKKAALMCELKSVGALRNG